MDNINDIQYFVKESLFEQALVVSIRRNAPFTL